VKAVVYLLENNWINPFGGSDDLLGISTATVAETEVQMDLLNAHNHGTKA
jgi:hypothetical protein